MSSTKSLIQRNTDSFEGRLLIAFNGKSLKEIAAIVEENASSFWNWAKERTDMPNRVLAKIANNTDYSLNWILTGQGVKKVKEENQFELFDYDELKKMIRIISLEVVREELAQKHEMNKGSRGTLLLDEEIIYNPDNLTNETRNALRSLFNQVMSDPKHLNVLNDLGEINDDFQKVIETEVDQIGKIGGKPEESDIKIKTHKQEKKVG